MASAPRAGAGGSLGSPEPHATGCGERCRWQQQPAPLLWPQLNLLQTPSITSSFFFFYPPLARFGLMSFVCMVWVQHLNARGAAQRWEDGTARGCSCQRLAPARAANLPPLPPPQGIGVVSSHPLKWWTSIGRHPGRAHEGTKENVCLLVGAATRLWQHLAPVPQRAGGPPLYPTAHAHLL